MHRPLPKLAMILGAAGILPFAIFAVGAVGTSQAVALTAERGLVGYGAVILAFLGGVHWGFTLDDPDNAPALRARLVLGVMPALVGWAALLICFVAEPVFGLMILIAGFIATVVVEARGHRRGLVPGGYMVMRWVISVVVVALLTTVVVLRLADAHVLL